MKKIMSVAMAVLMCGAALVASGCGPAPDEVVTGYLDAQKAFDNEKALAALREADQAGARETVKQTMDADKQADNKLVSYEITDTEQDSSNAIVKVNVTRTRKGKEKTREEVYYLEQENGEWRIDWGMATFLNTDYEAEMEETWATDTESEASAE